jgi:hypothetical protein
LNTSMFELTENHSFWVVPAFPTIPRKGQAVEQKAARGFRLQVVQLHVKPPISPQLNPDRHKKHPNGLVPTHSLDTAYQSTVPYTTNEAGASLVHNALARIQSYTWTDRFNVHGRDWYCLIMGFGLPCIGPGHTRIASGLQAQHSVTSKQFSS